MEHLSQTAGIPLVLIFMGVAGSGKSTVAGLFAKKTGAAFYEGDDFHPPQNIEKMRRGEPLTDGDRAAWLRTLRGVIARALDEGRFTVVACSALKAAYRDMLQCGDARVRFVFLTGTREVLQERLRQRQGHFFAPTLLDSALATLEPPSDAFTFDCRLPPEEIVHATIQALDGGCAGSAPGEN